MLSKYIGDKMFYKKVLMVAVPIMIQNGITNFVNLLDNIMVGQVGTVQMSGVAIDNTLMFVFNVCLFGALSGAGIFTAQFFGSGNHEGVRHTFRFKIWISLLLLLVAGIAFLGFGDVLINLYLQGEGQADSIAQTLYYGKVYLWIMVIGLVPYTVSQCYASTLRECGQTFIPMLAGIIAVVINLAGNYILIFGHFGAPELGVSGAAIATVLSRFVEAAIVVIWTHRHTAENSYVIGLYRTLLIPRKLVKEVIVKGMPLLVNETLWSAGMAILIQCYSYRGYDVVAAQNICQTVANVFNVIFIALGDSVAIIIGQLLGANELEEAVDQDRKMIVFCVGICFIIGTIMVLLSPVFPKLYNTTDSIRSLAAALVAAEAAYMPIHAFIHSSYFTLRSGGKTVITFMFDCGSLWILSIPAAFILSRFTAIPIITLYIIVKSLDIIKCIVGFVLIKKRVWVQNFVA